MGIYGIRTTLFTQKEGFFFFSYLVLIDNSQLVIEFKEKIMYLLQIFVLRLIFFYFVAFDKDDSLSLM